jgi:hypothetical protein
MTATAAREQLRAELAGCMADERRAGRPLPRSFWFEVRTIILSCLPRRTGKAEPPGGQPPGGTGAAGTDARGEPAQLIDDLAGLLATVAEPCRGPAPSAGSRVERLRARSLTFYLERMTGPPIHPLPGSFSARSSTCGIWHSPAAALAAERGRPSSGAVSPPWRAWKAGEDGTPAGLVTLLAPFRGWALPAARATRNRSSSAG